MPMYYQVVRSANLSASLMSSSTKDGDGEDLISAVFFKFSIKAESAVVVERTFVTGIGDMVVQEKLQICVRSMLSEMDVFEGETCEYLEDKIASFAAEVERFFLVTDTKRVEINVDIEALTMVQAFQA